MEKIRGFDFKGTSGFGRRFEILALKILKGSIDNNRNSFKNKYDIIWNGNTIDVKARNIGTKRAWKLKPHRNKYLTNADYYLLFCLKENRIIKVLLIPSKGIKRGICIGMKSKYDKYKIEFNSKEQSESELLLSDWM